MDLALEAEALEDRMAFLVVLDRGLRVRDEAIDEALDALEDLLVVRDDSLRLVTGEIPDDAERQVVLRVENRGRNLLGVALLDCGPDRREVADIGLEVGFAHTVTRCANDESEILGTQAFDDFTQAPPLSVRTDTAAHTHSARPGGQHEMAAGDRQARGDASPFRSDRLLGDLDDDLLTLAQDGVDPRGGRSASPATGVSPASTRAGLALGLARFENALEVVSDVQEGGLVEADVDKGGLHAGEHAAHLSLHDVPDDALVSLAFDVEFGELAVLQ